MEQHDLDDRQSQKAEPIAGRRSAVLIRLGCWVVGSCYENFLSLQTWRRVSEGYRFRFTACKSAMVMSRPQCHEKDTLNEFLLYSFVPMLHTVRGLISDWRQQDWQHTQRSHINLSPDTFFSGWHDSRQRGAPWCIAEKLNAKPKENSFRNTI